MTESTKCAHPACKCLVTPGGDHGKFCSDHCKVAADKAELKCDCNHPGCK